MLGNDRFVAHLNFSLEAGATVGGAIGGVRASVLARVCSREIDWVSAVPWTRELAHRATHTLPIWRVTPRWILTSLCFWLNGARPVGVLIVRRVAVMSGVPALAPPVGGVSAAQAWIGLGACLKEAGVSGGVLLGTVTQTRVSSVSARARRALAELRRSRSPGNRTRLLLGR